MGGPDNSIWEETMRTSTFKNITLILPMGKWTRTLYIQHTALLAPETLILYVGEANG